MAKTLQKKIKFSKGQVSPELLERTDLSFYDSSAQDMKNVVSTIYGGVRTRRGTRYIDKLTYINERTPSSITTNVFGSTTHFTDLTSVTSNTLSTNKNFATIDYGSNLTGTGKIDLKGVKVIPFEYKYTSTGANTQSVESGRYHFVCVGAGGGGAASYLSYRLADNNVYACAAAGGGSGARLTGRVTVNSSGSFKCYVGAGGSGSSGSNYSGTKTGSTGGSSYVEFTSGGTTTRFATCSGGKGGSVKTANHVATATAGAGGTFTKNSSVEVVKSSNGKSGKTSARPLCSGSAVTVVGGASVFESSTKGEGGGAKTGHVASATAGKDGYAVLSLLQPGYKLIFSVSTDNVTWTQVATRNVSTTASDISIPLDYCYRYVKITISGNESSNTKLSFQYIRNDVSAVLTGDHPIKMHKFIYNNEDRYLMIFVDQKVQVFKNDELIQVVTATGLSENYINDAKVAYKDDTIIITHPEMEPKQLQRQSNGTWVWSTFTLKNKPVYLPGSETTTPETVSITPSALEGTVKITAASSIFASSWVGNIIDGNGGRVRVTEYTSGTVVKGVTIIPFYTTDAITSWNYISGYQPVWGTGSDSVNRGWPSTCLFAQQRLWFGGSKYLPAHIWASRLDDYNNFKNAGNYDNDAIDVEMLTNNRIMNMVEQRGIHVFTSGDEWTIKEGTYTPNTISITKNTANGSLNITPVVIGGTVCFIEKNGKSLLSYSYDYDQASFMTDNISLFSSLIDRPVTFDVEINSSKDKADFIYIVLENGTMLSGCILLDQKIISLSQFVTDGIIKDVCCILDDIYLLVQRNDYYYLEKITNVRTDCSQELYITEEEITGLDAYSGKYVYVYNANTVFGKFYVDEGVLYLETPPGVLCEVGIAFDYNLESNPIAINGKTTSIKKRIATATVTCKDTERLEFNGQKKQTKSDVFDFYSCTKYGNDVRFNIKGEFYPVDILSVLLNINYEG